MGRLLFRVVLSTVLVVACSAGTAVGVSAQGLTGQISGTITDTGGGVIPGVTVTLTNAGTRATRESITGADGGFVFPDLLAGTYNLSAALSGFKAYEQKGIVLSSTERVALRAIHLEVGGLTETISVQAEALKVQTTTGERSALITQQQIEDTGIKGRDFMGVLKTLPGVVDTNGRDAPGWGTVSAGITINGRNSFNFSYDGVTNKDTGSNSGNYSAPGLDSIGEIRVQTSNFQAEYGRSSGATITVVTKSGTRDFHGTAAFYRRNESLNANEWARNRSRSTATTTRPTRSAARCCSRELRTTAAATSCSSSGRRTCCRAPIRARSTRATCPPRSSARGTSPRRSTARAGSSTFAIRWHPAPATSSPAARPASPAT